MSALRQQQLLANDRVLRYFLYQSRARELLYESLTLARAPRDWRSPDVAGKLRKNLARLLLESLHRLDIRNRPVAHAGDTQFRELVVRRDALLNHDVDRQRRFL